MKRIGLLLLSALLGGGVFVLSILADDAEGVHKVRWTALGTIVACAVVAVAAYENHRAESARRKTRELAVKAVADLAVTYNQALLPVTRELGGLAAEYAKANQQTSPPVSGTQAAHRAVILQVVLDGAVSLTAPSTPAPANLPRARSAFYTWDPVANVFRRQGIAHGDRTTEIKSQIPWQSDACGAKMLAILQAGGPFWRENEADGDDIKLDVAGAGYKAVIVAPVRSRDVLFGVLTVDAPEYEDFTRPHRDLMATLGHVLAASLVLDGP
ncbi:GAF domain-containing protein [Streptomyces sp. NBC_01546]|uniref:GAF domain-containing protein n=1 Tax=Streptomyces sp. NBC_01546 TaxID=2975872 RepID=UPI0038666C91